MKTKIEEFYERLKAGILRTLSANAINKAIGLISSMAITRLLSTEDYGIWSYSLNLYSYLAMVSGFGLVSGVLQFGAENKGTDKAYSFFKYCTKTGLCIDIGLVTLFGAAIAMMQLPIDGAKPFVLVILPVLLAEYMNAIGQSILRAQNRINEFANFLNANSALVAIWTCGGALIGLWGVIIGRYLAYLLSIAYLVWLLKRDIMPIRTADNLESNDKKQLWHYSIFTGASSAMNLVVYSLDITLIAAMIKNAEEIALYKVGTLIPNALQFIPTSVVIAVISNIIYNRDNIDWVRKNVKRTYVGLVFLNIFIIAILLVFSPIIIRIISGEKYLGSVPVLRVLTLGYFFSGTFRNLSVNVLAAFRRVHFGLFIAILTCLLDVSLNYLLISRFGMIGAAYATFAVDITAAAISFGYVVYLLRRGTINANSN